VRDVSEEARVVSTNPTIQQRELGSRLRELRLEHGLIIEDVAAKLLCSARKIGRLETGDRRPGLRDVRDLCALYNLDRATTNELMELAREAREQVWWTEYEDLKLDPYVGLEQAASSITSFSTFYVPALLQTEDYARGVIKKIAPKMDSDIFRQRVEVRMHRQQILEGDNHLRYRVLMDESALCRPVGGPELMIAQIDKILQIERDGKAAIQIIPFNCGVPAVGDSNFILLEFGDSTSISPLIFIESLTRNQYLQRKIDIERYNEAIGYLRYSALNPRDSVEHMTEMRKRYSKQ